MLSSTQVGRIAREAGFHAVGFAPAGPLDGSALRAWLDGGMSASMAWMGERIEERLDPRLLLPGAKTMVALACCVRTTGDERPSPVALYARGRDYHATMRDRLRALRRGLASLAPGVHTYAEVDTGPVLEKAWAERAGLGWIGKNGMLITQDHGSHVVLAVMLLDEAVDGYAAEPHPNRCGSCAACLSACPTRAIPSPGVVDSRRCLSFHTIENHETFPEELAPHATLAFGCDACQTVCPWNRADHACDDPRFVPRPIASSTLAEIASLSEPRWEELTRGTAIARARHAGLRRNALVAMGATHDPGLKQLEHLSHDPEPSVRAAARWALSRR